MLSRRIADGGHRSLTAQATEAPGRIPVWCTPLRFSAPTAAMINATAVHGFELDDVGTVLTAWGRARGGKDWPIPREDVLEKFRKVTKRQLAAAAQDEIISLCERLEILADATTLLDALPDRVS